MLKKFCYYFTIIPVVLLLSKCNTGNYKKIIHDSQIKIDVKRFDVDLMSVPFENLEDSIPFLRKKYPDFFELFNEFVIEIGNSNSPQYNDFLMEFVTYYGVQKANDKINEIYKDFSKIENDLSNGFKLLHYYFPDMTIPDIITYIGGFNQSIVVDDSILAIGLDNYLGSDFELYKRLGKPNYFTRNMHKDKIVPDCISSWLMTEYEFNDSVNNVVSHMIYYGKIYYATKKILPEVPDSLIIGFTRNHVKFCEKNEKKIWIYLVEYNRLFDTDRLTINKLINDGPFTNDLTQESPGKAVRWIGWQMVKEYMNHNDKTLIELMENNDYMSIFNDAYYSP